MALESGTISPSTPMLLAACVGAREVVLGGFGRVLMRWGSSDRRLASAVTDSKRCCVFS